MVMGNTLLLDASGASVPIRRSLENASQIVLSCGIDQLQFQARDQSSHTFVDYADIKAVERLLVDKNISLIIPGCTDVGFETYQRMEEVFRSVSNNAIAKINNLINKKKLSVTLDKLHLANATYKKNPMETTEGSKIIVKPSNSYSGKGITIMENPYFDSDRFKYACDKAKENSADGDYVLQRFIQGDLLSYSIFSTPKTTLTSPLIQETVNENHKVYTSRLADVRAVVRSQKELLTKKITEYIGSGYWFLHIQFMWCEEDGNAYVLDCAGRCPGDFYGCLVEQSSGFNYYANYGAVFSNGALDDVGLETNDGNLIRETLYNFNDNCSVGFDLGSFQGGLLFPDFAWRGSANERVAVVFYRAQK